MKRPPWFFLPRSPGKKKGRRSLFHAPFPPIFFIWCAPPRVNEQNPALFARRRRVPKGTKGAGTRSRERGSEGGTATERSRARGAPAAATRRHRSLVSSRSRSPPRSHTDTKTPSPFFSPTRTPPHHPPASHHHAVHAALSARLRGVAGRCLAPGAPRPSLAGHSPRRCVATRALARLAAGSRPWRAPARPCALRAGVGRARARAPRSLPPPLSL